MSLVTTTGPIQRRLDPISTAVAYYWFTKFFPCVGLDEVKAVWKNRAVSGNYQSQLCVQGAGWCLGCIFKDEDSAPKHNVPPADEEDSEDTSDPDGDIWVRPWEKDYVRSADVFISMHEKSSDILDVIVSALYQHSPSRSFVYHVRSW